MKILKTISVEYDMDYSHYCMHSEEELDKMLDYYLLMAITKQAEFIELNGESLKFNSTTDIIK